MPDFLQDIDPNTIRLAAFGCIFAVMALIELLLPKREQRLPRMSRWPTNIAIVVLDIILVRLVFPLGGVGLALLAQANGWGVVAQFGGGMLAAVTTFVLLDLAIWFQHLVSHKVPLLWRLHRVHHADGDIDVTTALRFHPVEILLSFVWKAVVILALGGPVEAVLAFEVVLNGAALFNHANVALPSWLDRVLRLVIVTPDMHRVHHSARRDETDSNYGFNLSIWDRLFRTYVAQPRGGHQGMEIGLGARWTPHAHELAFSLMIPFRSQSDIDQKKLNGK